MTTTDIQLDPETARIMRDIARQFPKKTTAHIVADPLGDVFITDTYSVFVIPADDRRAIVIRATYGTERIYGTDAGTAMLVRLKRTGTAERVGPSMITTETLRGLETGHKLSSAWTYRPATVDRTGEFTDETGLTIVTVRDATGAECTYAFERLTAAGFTAETVLENGTRPNGNACMARITDRATGRLIGLCMSIKNPKPRTA